MSISRAKEVSVVVPNYNYARYLKGRIKTIVRQTYPIHELIILDDASTDESGEVIGEIVQELKVRRPQLQVIVVKNERNSGKAMAQWKKGVEMARGEYVWIAEADDRCSRRFLEEAMKGFDDPEVVLAYTESMVMSGSGVVIAPNFRWSRDKERTGHYKRSYVKSGREEIGEIMAIRCTIPNVSAVVMRKDERLVRYMEEALKYTQVGDWYLYVKLLEKGKISYNRKALNRFRVHGGSVTGRARGSERHLQEVVEMHEMMKREYKLSGEMVKKMDKEVVRIREKCGKIGV